MRIKASKALFSVWKGPRFVVVGTAKECAEKTGLSENTIRWYAYHTQGSKQYRIRPVGGNYDR